MFSKLFNLVKWKIRGEVPTEQLVKMGLQVGSNFNRLNGCIIDYAHCWLINIGNNVTLAPRVHILAHDASTKMHLNYTKIGLVNIGNNVFIGAGSIILPNVTIGDNVIIGAGSIVTNDIEEGSVVIGNPARVIAKTQDYINRHNSNIQCKPVFDEKWTLRGGIDDMQKEKMRVDLKDSIGYVE